MIKAVIFDLYGTLLRLSTDSSPFKELARRTSVIHFRRAIEIALTTDNSTLKEYASRIGLPPQEHLSTLESRLQSDLEKVSLFLDVLPTLAGLRQRGEVTGVISNLATPYKQPFYRFGLDTHIDVAVFSCDCGLFKPDTNIFKAALIRTGAQAHETMMVGDSLSSDVGGSVNAGLVGVHLVRSGESKSDGFAQAFTTISTLNAVLDMVT